MVTSYPFILIELFIESESLYVKLFKQGMSSSDLSSRQSAEICFWALLFLIFLFCPVIQNILLQGMSNLWLRLLVMSLVFIAFLYCICGLVLQKYHPSCDSTRILKIEDNITSD